MMEYLCWFLFILQLSGLQSSDVTTENKNYISKLTSIYGILKEDSGDTNARKIYTKIVLPALIVDKINLETEDYVWHAREVRINHLNLSSGYFDMQFMVQTLYNGVVLLNITGTADLAESLTVDIARMTRSKPHHSLSLARRSLSLTGSANTSAFNNGSNGIKELISMEASTKCTRQDDKCVKGSVVIDPWMDSALLYQRWLGYDVPLNFVQFIGTHNSFNNKADGYGTGDFLLGELLEKLSLGRWDFVWAQQWFTITDQLNMGVRYLMLDPVYFWGKMRLCHCGGGSVKWFDDVVKFIEKELKRKIDFDSHDLGCLPDDRPFSSAIQEISDWLKMPQNSGEFIVVYINDETSDSDWGHIDMIQDPVAEIMKDSLFTPTLKKEHYPDRWPSINEIIGIGKNVMVTCTSRCANENIFEEMMIPQWDRDTVKYFKPFPECSGYQPSDWYLVGGESQVVGPIYNGPREEGLVIKENFSDLSACPLSVIQLDLTSPELMSKGVWSWSKGYSFKNITNTSCPIMNATGRWLTKPCQSKHYHLCTSLNDSYTFSISTESHFWTYPQCPKGTVFGVPKDGYQNQLLVSLITKHQVSDIWINATTITAPSTATQSQASL